MKKAWKHWKKIATHVANVEGTIFLYIIYFLIIVPLGIVLKLAFANTLRGKRFETKQKSFWLHKRGYSPTLSWATKQ